MRQAMKIRISPPCTSATIAGRIRFFGATDRQHTVLGKRPPNMPVRKGYPHRVSGKVIEVLQFPQTLTDPRCVSPHGPQLVPDCLPVTSRTGFMVNLPVAEGYRPLFDGFGCPFTFSPSLMYRTSPTSSPASGSVADARDSGASCCTATHRTAVALFIHCSSL